MALSEGEIEKLGSLKSEDNQVKDTGLPEASYAPNTGMDYSQFYGSPLMVQQPGMDYYKSFEPQAPMPSAAASAPVAEQAVASSGTGQRPGFYGAYEDAKDIPYSSELDSNMYDAQGNRIEFDYATGVLPGTGNTRDGQESMFGDYTMFFKPARESLIDLPSLLGNAPADTSSLIPGLITDNTPQINQGRSRSGTTGRNRK
jgi:hypothetical protein